MSNETTVDRQSRIELLQKKGVGVFYDEEWVGEVGTPERHSEPVLDRVTAVNLGLTDTEWCAVAMREGEYYVGGCCGNMSAVQDLINEAFRDSGGMDAGQLLRVGDLCRGHDGFEGAFEEWGDEEFQQRLTDWEQWDPWEKIGVLFTTVEPLLHEGRLGQYHAQEQPVERAEGDRAMNRLYNTLSSITWGDLFSRSDENHQQLYERTRLVKLARINDPLKKVLEVVESNQDRFEGWAIVSPGTDEVRYNGYGLCLYTDRSEAEDMVAKWQKWAENDKHDEALPSEIVRCSVSVKEGMVVHRD